MKPEFELVFTYVGLPILRSLKTGSYFANGFLILGTPNRPKVESFLEATKNFAVKGHIHKALRITANYHESLMVRCREHQAANPFIQP